MNATRRLRELKIASIDPVEASYLLTGYCLDCGYRCEIDATPTGCVIYAATRDLATKVASLVSEALHRLRVRVDVEHAFHDREQPRVTSWWVGLHFDWRIFE